MAHIERFSVTGLAGRPGRISRELDRYVNVVFGLNGTGKTSLLRLLDSAMTGKAATVLNVPFETAEVAIYSDQYKKTFVRTLASSSLAAGKEALKLPAAARAARRVLSRSDDEGAWTIAPALPKGASGRWAHVYLPINRMYGSLPATRTFVTLGEESSADPDQELNGRFAETLQKLWIEYFAGVQTVVREAQADGLARILRSVLAPGDPADAQELDPDVAHKRVTAFLKRQGSPQAMPSAAAFSRRFEQDPRLRSIVADIDQVERQIAAATAPRTRLQELIARLFVGKAVQFHDSSIAVETGDNNALDLGLLSSGEKQILRLLVECLRARTNSMLVDEPELSMHVDWQEDLVKSMRELNPDAQLVMATHSPEVMADIDDDKVFRL